MGLLVDGKWQDVWYDTKSTKGRFERSKSQFRNWVTADGSAGPTGEGGFKAEPGRYHLYVSYACPWAHRTLIFRALKKLEDVISVSVVDYLMVEEGWTFYGTTGSTGDDLYGSKRLYEIYTRADPNYSGRVTVPVLWDKQRQTIVSNESSEIIRMLNTAFNEFGDASLDFYPDALAAEIDALNDFIYPNINNGVYRAGFATSQDAYEEAFKQLFAALDTLEDRLSRQRYLAGSSLTEADWRLFTTLLRFDPVYVGHFKCNLRRIADYPNLWNYTRELYQVPGVASTVNMEHIKGHYYRSHKTINPTGIVPTGPEIDFTAPHDRDRFSKS
ncbi:MULTISPECIES: glutathione S-transferase family protein [Brucella/Ochrobactrum group]|uniref:Glutathione S-transferase, omega n=1 Tax=Ochrobactrum soli TaxID=2448455 RepID=A0A2P9HPJ9_9HYPH|nr:MULTISPECIES: glutathione S-transferase family protein [Brucella]MCI1000280.1 glutathione S-transferase family protein [Ochrobactrum sp. C6C9]MDX4076246.1 glutathione S-transferase family protein [Brucella sp. NBRC 113783]RRD25023.1 glutathione S-transferase family protein [Brucellaceae bacterium VT-16-1752]SPL66002.1 Glutathione S-transferase, omega [[Ochrobactrum] soli]